MRDSRVALSVCLLVLLIFSFGCQSKYITPGRAANMREIANLDQISDTGIRDGFTSVPAAPLPAAIAAVRVQSPHYSNHYLREKRGTIGKGSYSVVTIREFETDEHMQSIRELSEVRDVVALNRLLLPSNLQDDRELRLAASKLKADLVLLYTMDTEFRDNESSVVLSTFTLGLSPTRKVSINSTAAAILVDTRTGFVYGAIEANSSKKFVSSAWESAEAIDRERVDVEKQAFSKLVDEFTTFWPGAVKTMAMQ